MPLQRRPPGHELETETIIDHGEPTGRERDALAVDAGDLLTLGRRPVGEASFSGKFRGNPVQLLPFQSVEQIAREHDPLTLPTGQAFLDEVIDTTVHRLTNFGAESSSAVRRFARKQLTVDPGRA